MEMTGLATEKAPRPPALTAKDRVTQLQQDDSHHKPKMDGETDEL